MPQQARILAIIVNWNKRNDLESLLESLKSLQGTAFDTVVVENASTDGSPQMVREKFPDVTLLETGENLGGTGGFNFGMSYGLKHEKKYDFLWLLDNDIVIHPGALDGLLAAMNQDRHIALAGSTILYLDDPSRVQECGVKIDWRTCGLERNAEGPLENLPSSQLIESDYVAACSMLARVEAIRRVGIWDPAYFIGWDDMDWGVRFRQAGYRVVGVTSSHVRHEAFNDRRATAAPASKYGWSRNQLYFLRRHAPAGKLKHVMRVQMRMLMAQAENYDKEGAHLDARALREAAHDFLQYKMGPPPSHLRAKPERKRHKSKVNPDKIKRIGLIAFENYDTVLRASEILQRDFKNAEVNLLVMSHKTHELRRSLPHVQTIRTNTITDRIISFLTLPFRFDAIASLEHVPLLMMQSSAKHQVRFDPDLNYTIVKRNWPNLFNTMVNRICIIYQARKMTAEALRKTPPPVDYFGFQK